MWCFRLFCLKFSLINIVKCLRKTILSFLGSVTWPLTEEDPSQESGLSGLSSTENHELTRSIASVCQSETVLPRLARYILSTLLLDPSDRRFLRDACDKDPSVDVQPVLEAQTPQKTDFQLALV